MEGRKLAEAGTSGDADDRSDDGAGETAEAFVASEAGAALAGHVGLQEVACHAAACTPRVRVTKHTGTNEVTIARSQQLRSKVTHSSCDQRALTGESDPLADTDQGSAVELAGAALPC